MATIPYTNSKGEEDSFYMEDRLYAGVKKIQEKVIKKDSDDVYLVDGGEGTGKSVFSMQLAKAIDSSFNISRICFNPAEFIKAIQEANKGQAIIYDEAYTGLASRQSLSEINKLIVSMMMEMRQKNLVVIVVLPTFFMLDRYVSIFRSRGLFHIYTSKGRRGYFVYFNQKNKKKLYILGKKLMSYAKPHVDFKGRFYGKYTVDEMEYRARKDYALKHRKPNTREEKYQDMFKQYIVQLYLKENKSYNEISEELKDKGVVIPEVTLRQWVMLHRNAQKVV